MSRYLIVGNWKMNGTSQANAHLLQSIIAQSEKENTLPMAVCVPFIYIQQVSELLANTSIAVGSQDVSHHLSGAYTGEISASMLADFQCAYAIVGHSERRQYHHESNTLVAQKALAVIQAGMTPIICVGESQQQREAGKTLDVIDEQLQALKKLLNDQSLKKSVIAYEPVWAIGTGLTATPEEAQAVHQFIRKQLGSIAAEVSILYGGSVKASNAAELMKQPDIDGALVGGASLKADEFIAIAMAA